MSEQWEAFLALLQKLQMEKMVVFLAKWFKPHADITEKDIAAKLDKFAAMHSEYKTHIKESLSSRSPRFCTDDEKNYKSFFSHLCYNKIKLHMLI